MAFLGSSNSGVNPIRVSTACPRVLTVGGRPACSIHTGFTAPIFISPAACWGQSHLLHPCFTGLQPPGLLPPKRLRTVLVLKAASKPEGTPQVSRGELSPCQPGRTSRPRVARGGRRHSPCGTFAATSHVSSLPEDAHRVPEARWPSRSNGGHAPSCAQTLRLVPEEQTQAPPAQWEPKGTGFEMLFCPLGLAGSERVCTVPW